MHDCDDPPIFDYEELMRTGQSYARKRGRPNDAEDFGQHYAMEAFRCGHQGNINWIFIGYLRLANGDLRAKKRHHGQMLSLDEPIYDEDDGSMHDVVAEPEPEPKAALDLLPRNSCEEFVIAQMLAGYTMADIARQIMQHQYKITLMLRESRERYESMNIALLFAPAHTRQWVKQCFKGAKWKRKAYKRKARKTK